MFDPIWLFALMPVFWCVVCTLIALVGGWHALARHYRAVEMPEGKRFWMQSGQFGWVNYGNCLNLRVAAEGLYVAMLPMFRVGHPSLLIPWKDLHVLKVRNSWLCRDVTLGVGTPQIARIRMPLGVIQAAGEMPSDELL
jgi:hypothetical protein